MQSLANEGALALDRLRSSAALGEALERERLIAGISAKFRTQLDLDSVLRVAVDETGRALGVSRCFVRLGGPDEAGVVEAEWMQAGLDPVAPYASRLPGANLALREGRTIVVSDVRTDPAFDDPSVGSRDVLEQLDTRSILATADRRLRPDDRGVRAPPPRADGVDGGRDRRRGSRRARGGARRAHRARLLGENDERLRQQTGLLRAAQQVTAELELDAVLQRLADEVAGLVGAESADLYLHDPRRRILRCAAVHGLPDELVGYEFPSDRGVAAQAMRTGAPVVSRDYDAIAERVPHPAYEGFTDAIVAPIVWGGETRGVLGVGTSRARPGVQSRRRRRDRRVRVARGARPA